jgi:hypothetical protein
MSNDTGSADGTAQQLHLAGYDLDAVRKAMLLRPMHEAEIARLTRKLEAFEAENRALRAYADAPWWRRLFRPPAP